MFEKETSEAIRAAEKNDLHPSFSREEKTCADLIEHYIEEGGYTLHGLVIMYGFLGVITTKSEAHAAAKFAY